MLRRGGSGDNKNSRADDGANPKRNQVAGTKCTLQTMLASFLRFIEDGIDRFGRQQIGHSTFLNRCSRISVMNDTGRSLPRTRI